MIQLQITTKGVMVHFNYGPIGLKSIPLSFSYLCNTFCLIDYAACKQMSGAMTTLHPWVVKCGGGAG